MELAKMSATSKMTELWLRREAPKSAIRRPLSFHTGPSSLAILRLLPRHTRARGAVRCQDQSMISSEGFSPQAEFCKVEAILRPWRLSHVAAGLLKVGIRGVTVSDVRGFGAQGGLRERQAGSEFGEDSFVSKVKLEVVVSKDQVDTVIDTIIDQARTGEIGDGKIFVSPVADVIRVRTGERGLKAERMAGGRTDLLSSSNGKGIS
eukprot:c10902_g1_i1 orf=83-700(+)